MIITNDSEEFKIRFEKLRNDCPVAVNALSDKSLEDWPSHLRKDALQRMGLKAVVAYEVIQ